MTGQQGGYLRVAGFVQAGGGTSEATFASREAFFLHIIITA